MDEKTLKEILKEDTPEARKAVQKIDNLAREVESVKDSINKLESKASSDVEKDDLLSLKGKLKESESALRNSVNDGMSYLNFQTEKNGAVCYSGESGGEMARQHCMQPGNEHCKTIEMTSAGKWFESADGLNLKQNLPNWEDRREVWASASKEFASNAKGEVTAFISERDLVSQYHQFEKPILENSPQVTNINKHNVDINVAFKSVKSVEADFTKDEYIPKVERDYNRAVTNKMLGSLSAEQSSPEKNIADSKRYSNA